MSEKFPNSIQGEGKREKLILSASKYTDHSEFCLKKHCIYACLLNNDNNSRIYLCILRELHPVPFYGVWNLFLIFFILPSRKLPPFLGTGSFYRLEVCRMNGGEDHITLGVEHWNLKLHLYSYAVNKNILLYKNLSSQAYAHVFSANFAADCVKNPCRATARLPIFALSATKLCSKIRTHFLWRQVLILLLELITAA